MVRIAFTGLMLTPPPSASFVTEADVQAHFDAGGGGLTTNPDQAGLLWAERDGALYLSRLAVHPDHRRLGLAFELLVAAEAEAGRRSLQHIWLSTRLALASNRRLFARCGFIEGARHAHPGFAEHTFIDLVKHVRTKPTPPPNVIASTA